MFIRIPNENNTLDTLIIRESSYTVKILYYILNYYNTNKKVEELLKFKNHYLTFNDRNNEFNFFPSTENLSILKTDWINDTISNFHSTLNNRKYNTNGWIWSFEEEIWQNFIFIMSYSPNKSTKYEFQPAIKTLLEWETNPLCLEHCEPSLTKENWKNLIISLNYEQFISFIKNFDNQEHWKYKIFNSKEIEELRNILSVKYLNNNIKNANIEGKVII